MACNINGAAELFNDLQHASAAGATDTKLGRTHEAATPRQTEIGEYRFQTAYCNVGQARRFLRVNRLDQAERLADIGRAAQRLSQKIQMALAPVLGVVDFHFVDILAE